MRCDMAGVSRVVTKNIVTKRMATKGTVTKDGNYNVMVRKGMVTKGTCRSGGVQDDVVIAHAADVVVADTAAVRHTPLPCKVEGCKVAGCKVTC